MGWSLRIARIAGIDLKLHLSFLLMLPLGAALFGGSGVAGMLFGALMVVLLFSSVLLHEFGHALTARALGIPVREIQLLPLGGVAVLGRPVLNPGHELLITIMGPVVNVLLVIVLAFVAIFSGIAGRLSPETLILTVGEPSFDGVVLWLIQANALLALFNMLPAFPLDGGRVTRALLAFAMPYRRATVITGAVGQGIAALLAVWGVLSASPLMIASAVFIFFAARQEVAASTVADILGALRAADALPPRAANLYVGQRVREAAELMAATGQSAAAVLQGERPIGVILRPDAQLALTTGRGEQWVTLAMRRGFVGVQATDTLDNVRIVMAEQNTSVVAVYAGERFLGLLTIDDIANAFSNRDRPLPARPGMTPLG